VQGTDSGNCACECGPAPHRDVLMCSTWRSDLGLLSSLPGRAGLAARCLGRPCIVRLADDLRPWGSAELVIACPGLVTHNLSYQCLTVLCAGLDHAGPNGRRRPDQTVNRAEPAVWKRICSPSAADARLALRQAQ